MRDSWSLFKNYLSSQDAPIDIQEFAVNALLVLVLSFVLQFTYIRCGKSLSNKRSFAANFLLLTFTTMIIITIVKSSIELSLGLVGALSIVRFRAAIKEPEELAYLFFTISIGLGLGANQRPVVLLAFIILIAIIWGKHFLSNKERVQSLFLTVTSSSKEITHEQLQVLVNDHFNRAELKRLDEDASSLEMAYYLDIKNKDAIGKFKSEVIKLDETVSVVFIDNKI
ncbi:MAG: putative membrane protein YhiD involved in acid resistance [Patiriisocius sp.]|jgi:uncharacterized membrane protein YhiD involved in acid resistance